MTGERQSAETALSDALDEAIRLTAGDGNGTATRSRPIEEWRRLDRLFRKARAALPASTESAETALSALAARRGYPVVSDDKDGGSIGWSPDPIGAYVRWEDVAAALAARHRAASGQPAGTTNP